MYRDFIRLFHPTVHRLSTTYPQGKNGTRMPGYFTVIPINSRKLPVLCKSLYYNDLQKILTDGTPFFNIGKIFTQSVAVFRIFSTFFHNLSTNKKTGRQCRICMLNREKSFPLGLSQEWICIPNSGSDRRAIDQGGTISLG